LGNAERGSSLSVTSTTLGCCSVFALEPASARDVDCRAERLSDQMASLAMLGCIPVLGLMLELLHSRPPTGTCL
jgi:hypothetical protein